MSGGGAGVEPGRGVCSHIVNGDIRAGIECDIPVCAGLNGKIGAEKTDDGHAVHGSISRIPSCLIRQKRVQLQNNQASQGNVPQLVSSGAAVRQHGDDLEAAPT